MTMEKVSFSFSSMYKYEDFITQYYSLLENHPEELQAFYGESSKLSRPGSDGKIATFSSLSEIHEKIQSFGPIYHRKVFSIYPQVSGNTFGFIVLVTGQVVRKEDGASRNFAQTFFLAVNNDGVFYILNDVFNYVDEAPPSSSLPDVAVPELVSIASTSTSASEKVVEVVVAGGGGEQTSSKVESYASKISNASPLPASATSTTTTSSAGKKLVLLKPRQQEVVKSSSAPPEAAAEPFVAEHQQQAPEKNEPQSPAEKVAAQLVKNGGNGRQEADDDKNTRYAVHVTQLPLCTKRYQVENLFKKFGAIKQEGGVQIRKHWNDDGELDYSYAFVEFEEKSSMEAALKVGQVMVNGRALPIFRRRW